MYKIDYTKSTQVVIDVWMPGECKINVSKLNISHRANVFISRRTTSTAKLIIIGAFSNLGNEFLEVECVANRGLYFTLHLIKSVDGALAFVTKL